jgi:hypothetical protein
MNESGSLIEAAQNYDLIEILNRGFAYAILAAGGLSVIFIFIGGISFILSGGQEEKIKRAVGTIRYAIIGLIVTIMAIFVIQIIGKGLFGLDVVKYINFQEIIDLVTEIGSGGGRDSLD